MQRGSILESARRDTKGGLLAGAILAGVCLAVLGLNWKFLYNAVAGPFPFTAALSQSPGSREWVTASGTLIDTGATEKLTVRLRSVPFIKTSATTARFVVMPIEGRMLLAKVDPDFSGTFVSGKLVRLPPEYVKASDASLVYPFYIDAGGGGGYRSHVNLFVMIAVPLLPIAMVITALSARSRVNLARYKPIARLARYGNPMGMVTAIEMELASAGPSAKVGPMWIGPNWMVMLTPLSRHLQDRRHHRCDNTSHCGEGNEACVVFPATVRRRPGALRSDRHESERHARRVECTRGQSAGHSRRG